MSNLKQLPHITFILLLLSSSLPSLVSSIKCHKAEKKALFKLRAGFGNPNDLPWTPGVGCSAWNGVIWDSITGRVLNIDISSVNLSGTISPAIGDLPMLSEIHIQYAPFLTGSIPYSITKLPLTKLTIRFTALSGPIPAFLGELKDLTDIDLSGNLLTGPIPEPVASLPKLDRLTLFGNKLTGTIPPSLFRGQTRGDLLYLSDNLLTARSPGLLCHKAEKKALFKLRAGFGNPNDLPWTPGVGCSAWNGVIWDSITGRVLNIDISSVNLSGTISPAIGDLSMLSEIHIQYAPFLTGSIPYSITKLPLTKLTIRFTALSGPIPAFLGELKDLTDIDLSGNLLTGPIPEPVASLPKLDRLTLFGNKLTGTIPPSLFRGQTRGDLLYLSDNLLTCEIPRSVGDADVAYIYLAGNRFTGDASFLFEGQKNTFDIDLSRNRFEMNMSSLSFTHSLNKLDLSNNRIYGSIPESVATLEGLNTFNVSFNRLCGRIPIGGNMNLFDGSCYTHNKCLCGSPLPSCRA
ncbi:hypothetical protein J5N97_002846 [Dioscorea zingiberensis]|uniref:Uncharacterized protein n=1 Tax=Dioscorea zingiberensis TaxID=325984 RepID=A0A9D5D5J5_9LILI|nr:hypothetical protein J5N97_002846 [Dioscorea zingiberensis]